MSWKKISLAQNMLHFLIEDFKMFYKKVVKFTRQKLNIYAKTKGFILKFLRHKDNSLYSDERFIGYEAFIANYVDKYKKM